MPDLHKSDSSPADSTPAGSSPSGAPSPRATTTRSAVSLTGTGLHLSFGTHHVLRGVDIAVDAGTTTTVIGPSGSGKSTLLRVLNRLHEPDQGDILLDGRSVLKDNPDELRRRIGMVFQHFNLFPHKTVVDNVALGPRKLKGLSKEEAREVALRQLEIVGLTNKADVRPARLSGGQQQRVAIARALAMTPEVMFFDEATSALDRARQRCARPDGRPGHRRHDDGRRHPRDGFRAQRLRQRSVHGSRRRRGNRCTRSDLRRRLVGSVASVPVSGAVDLVGVYRSSPNNRAPLR